MLGLEVVMECRLLPNYFIIKWALVVSYYLPLEYEFVFEPFGFLEADTGMNLFSNSFLLNVSFLNVINVPAGVVCSKS